MGFRYVVVDYMHLAYKCMVAEPLSTVVTIGGIQQEVDTSVLNYTIKDIWRLSGRGEYAIGVCFEGGESEHKRYFQNTPSPGVEVSYKGNRNSMRQDFYTGIDMTMQSLISGGGSVYRAPGYEADDLVASLVYAIKQVDTTTPIDVITNDADLLPLVDEQVSVYKRGTLGLAEPGCPSLKLYYQVTPRTWAKYLASTSEFKQFKLPYNSMLLYKMIRGDKSDGILPIEKGYGAVKMNRILGEMQEAGVNFAEVFRYNVDFDAVIVPALQPFFTVELIERMRYIYNGINLRLANVQPMHMLDLGKLSLALSPYRINIR